MAVEQGYPVTLIHPQHRAATITTDPNPRTGDSGSQGRPELFPSVTVNGYDDEAKYRAQGYLRYGEAPPRVDHYEYPKMMRHPDYREAVPAQTEARIENNRIVGTFTIPGKPAEMPDLVALSAEQEEKLREQGYKPAGEYNKEALESVIDGSVYEEEYIADQYPKWVEDLGAPLLEDGTHPKKLIDRDPSLPDTTPDPSYPRYENGVIVPDPRFPEVPDPHLYPMWVHKDGIPGEESRIAKNPKEEFELRRKLNPPAPEPDPQEELPLPLTAKRTKPASATV